jgi:peptidoglycan/xylan/chitin deacetylase (PgdA/CDA1 family)
VHRRLLRNRSSRAVFLSYHSIAPRGPRYLTISEELFERQLSTLRDRGFHSGDVRALTEAAEGRPSSPTVFLTFDDGFRDNYETALPLLREYGFHAFVFVLPPLVNTGAALAWPEVAGHQQTYPESMRSVTWRMLEEMKADGLEIGSHSLSHAHLTELPGERLRQELSDSRTRIKERLGSCDVLAYPFGEWDAEVATAARDCGYRFAFSLPTATGQLRATPFSIPRVNVDYRDDGRRFVAKLSPFGRRVLLSTTVRAVTRRGIGSSRLPPSRDAAQ